jgi:GNAT superfamily N-acetyltransferase
MNHFIFNFNKHENYIDGFLTSASLAHKQEKKSVEWFLWKFRDNPFGQSILACAEEDGIITGCVALGMQNFILNDKKIKGALSFETFVHPDFQGRGLFKLLIKNAEKEATEIGIRLLLNFPNRNSLSGFLRLNWIQLNIPEYWLKVSSLSKTLLNLKDIKKGFQPDESNLMDLNPSSFDNFEQVYSDRFTSELNTEYLKWRFLTFPNAEYIIINDDNCVSVARVGYRGKLKEVQVLLVNPKSKSKFNFQKLLSSYQTKSKYDLISFPVSSNNSMKSKLKRNLFIKVPNSTNVCYKILDNSTNFDMNQLSLSAINFHTY